MKKICFSFNAKNATNEWDEALKLAVKNYNSVFSSYNSKIAFCASPIGTCDITATHYVEILVDDYGSNNSNWVGLSDGVSFLNKTPGRWIKINKGSSSFYNYYDVNTKAALIMHEIGHIIGLSHTESYEGTPIDITKIDRAYMNSIFIGADMKAVFSPNFSDMDIKALKAIYP